VLWSALEILHQKSNGLNNLFWRKRLGRCATESEEYCVRDAHGAMTYEELRLRTRNIAYYVNSDEAVLRDIFRGTLSMVTWLYCETLRETLLITVF
jgi:hypothetical protein